MPYYITKIVISVLLIIAISEIAKRSTLLGGILASVPLVSVLAMIWLYVETRDIERVAVLSSSVFWLVIPSLALFLILPVLLKKGLQFYISLGLSLTITVICYFIMIAILHKLGIRL